MRKLQKDLQKCRSLLQIGLQRIREKNETIRRLKEEISDLRMELTNEQEQKRKYLGFILNQNHMLRDVDYIMNYTPENEE